MYLDIIFSAFPEIFNFLKNGVFSIFQLLRTTYLFGSFSILSLFIVSIVFDLIFATFFVTFNIRNNNTTKNNTSKGGKDK